MTPPPPISRETPALWRDRNPGVYCVSGRSRRVGRGFTLIEILVTISIIALLAGLSAFGASLISKAAQEQRVKSMCQALLGAQDEYKSKNAYKLNLNHDGTNPINWGGGTFSQNAPGSSGSAGGGGLSSSERFVVGCFRFDSSGAALRAAVQGDKALIDSDSDGFLEIRDPWDNELVYRSSNNGTGTGFDGIDNSDLPVSRDPFLISPGRDGMFGTDDDITSLEIGS